MNRSVLIAGLGASLLLAACDSGSSGSSGKSSSNPVTSPPVVSTLTPPAPTRADPPPGASGGPGSSDADIPGLIVLDGLSIDLPGDGLFAGADIAGAFVEFVHLLADEFAGLGCRFLALAAVAPGPFQSCFCGLGRGWILDGV